jgi:hypothetical protein
MRIGRAAGGAKGRARERRAAAWRRALSLLHTVARVCIPASAIARQCSHGVPQAAKAAGRFSSQVR